MPQAQVRAQLPNAYALSPAQIKALGPTGGVHLITLCEEENFMPKHEIKPLPDTASFPIGALNLQRNTNGVHLIYRYTTKTGAPNRSHRPPIELDVPTGRRARIMYNGRFSGYSIEWLYKLSTITVTVGISTNQELFTAEVHSIIEDLADLY